MEALLRSYRAPNVFNPWGESDSTMDLYSNSHELRYRRLLAHFNCDARYLLIGEAPGYQGCRWTGVPFTSERLVIEGGIPRMAVMPWTTSNGRTYARITQRETSWAEPSATIVWKTLRALGIHEQTVCWNAFPWHPHKPGEPYSNRTPVIPPYGSYPESDALMILGHVIREFPSALIVAVGKVAAEACEQMTDRRVHAVRHPANGGATLFRQQLEALCTDTK